MAETVTAVTEKEPGAYECMFNMLWNTLLAFHFPLDRNYASALQKSKIQKGKGSSFFVVKSLCDEKSTVLVVKLAEPTKNTPADRKKVMEQLVQYTQECFDDNETQFSRIFAIGAIGFSYVVYEMNRSGSPVLIFDWADNMTDPLSFDRLIQVTAMVDEMRNTTHNQQ